MRRPSSKQWIGGLAVTLIIAAYGLYQYRERRIERLYAEAAGIPPFFHGTTQARTAVKELGAYRGRRTTEMLLNIALGRTGFRWPETESEAINALADRKEPGLSEAVAILLQPQQPLPTRKAAAAALRKLTCRANCVGTILHYLERVMQGEPNYEDRSTFPSGLSEGVSADIRKEQASLYDTLYEVLRRESQATILSLVQVYGLGTDAPSKFALSLLSRMRFRDACPALLQSEQLLKQSSAELFAAPREELEATLDDLKCR